jgi:hypothetical protein
VQIGRGGARAQGGGEAGGGAQGCVQLGRGGGRAGGAVRGGGARGQGRDDARVGAWGHDDARVEAAGGCTDVQREGEGEGGSAGVGIHGRLAVARVDGEERPTAELVYPAAVGEGMGWGERNLPSSIPCGKPYT